MGKLSGHSKNLSSKAKPLDHRDGSSSIIAQLCLTLCNSRDCRPPGSSAHGILQRRILEWVAMPFHQGFSWPRNRTQVSYYAGRFFMSYREVTGHRDKYISILVNTRLVLWHYGNYQLQNWRYKTPVSHIKYSMRT